jgi:HK97 family phage prohead protease
VLLVAGYDVDRGGDVIQRGAFRAAIAAWQSSDKQLPLAWNHETNKPEQLIGTVDTASMKETRDGIVAEAHLDLDGSSTAREVWRLVKPDSIGVSFGHLANDQEDASDGTRLLKSIRPLEC